MSEENIKNPEQTKGNTIDKEALLKLASNINKDENPLDLGSLMKVATNLLKEDSVVNSLFEVGKAKQSQLVNEAENQENSKLAAISYKLEQVLYGIMQMNSEISKLKEQNQIIIDDVRELNSSGKKKK